MKYLFQNEGKPCAAKTMFSLTLIFFLIKIMLSGMEIAGYKFEIADYNGMAHFLTVLAGIYGWRSHTKAVQK